MTKLIGTGNNQVSTNGMLGGMAFQSPEGVQVDKLQEQRYNVVTQQDIGTAPNQVPINGFLGSLAYLDSIQGIDFGPSSGTGTATSNILDDYEEGTFTPTFTGSTTNPTITYINQVGRYTKIGNVCYIEIRLVTSNVSGGSGNLYISGLPFPQSANTSIGGAFTKGFVYAWAQDPETFITFGGDSTIYIYRNDSTNTIAQVSDLTSGAANNYLNISGSYITS